MRNFEQQAQKEGYNVVVGVDEAGRGPLAGTVVAAAVFLKSRRFKEKIADSKKLSPLQRQRAFIEISQKATYGIGIISESVIDRINILEATFLAMNTAVNQLLTKLPADQVGQSGFYKKCLLIIDGNIFRTDLPCSYKTIVKGDQLCLSIACASIIAKVTRDRILDTYDQLLPMYGFSKHKGYATLKHRQAIKKFGPSFIHRRSFHVCSLSAAE